MVFSDIEEDAFRLALGAVGRTAGPRGSSLWTIDYRRGEGVGTADATA